MAKQVTIVAGDVSNEAVEWLKAHGATIEGFGLLTITLPAQALIHKGNRGWDYSIAFYNSEGNDEESYIDVELYLDAYETALTLRYEGDRSCQCRGRGCPSCVVELAMLQRGENPYRHHFPILASIETPLDPDQDARIRVLLPDATGVQNLPARGIQDADEAVKAVKDAYPTARIVQPHVLDEEVLHRQPQAQPGPVVEDDLVDIEF